MDDETLLTPTRIRRKGENFYADYFYADYFYVDNLGVGIGVGVRLVARDARCHH
jgi:hypothetical protein